jgi:hypothetical protein
LALVALVGQVHLAEIPHLVHKVALLHLIRSLPVVVVAVDIPVSMAFSLKPVCLELQVVAVVVRVITGMHITMDHQLLHLAELELQR